LATIGSLPGGHRQEGQAAALVGQPGSLPTGKLKALQTREGSTDFQTCHVPALAENKQIQLVGFRVEIALHRHGDAADAHLSAQIHDLTHRLQREELQLHRHNGPGIKGLVGAAPGSADLLGQQLGTGNRIKGLHGIRSDNAVTGEHSSHRRIERNKPVTAQGGGGQGPVGDQGEAAEQQRAGSDAEHGRNGRKRLIWWEARAEHSVMPVTAVDAISPDQTLAGTSIADPLVIGGRSFRSRLMTGTGKYPSLQTMQASIAVSACDIVTVAVRRVQSQAAGHQGLMEAIDWSRIWMLPNTAGCATAEEAVRVARLGRELAKLAGQEDNTFIKLEVIPDTRHLLPDPIGTLEAAEQLVKEGFTVLPYINADPLLAKRLEDAGCATVMPLGSPIGSGQGIRNAANIALIIENATVPVVVDAGIGVPSEAAQAMEMGADALLINSAIALAGDPAAMAQAMAMACQAGRTAFQAGRLPVRLQASASSPLQGRVGSQPT
jgi:thiazole synthase